MKIFEDFEIRCLVEGDIDKEFISFVFSKIFYKIPKINTNRTVIRCRDISSYLRTINRLSQKHRKPIIPFIIMDVDFLFQRNETINQEKIQLEYEKYKQTYNDNFELKLYNLSCPIFFEVKKIESWFLADEEALKARYNRTRSVNKFAGKTDLICDPDNELNRVTYGQYRKSVETVKKLIAFINLDNVCNGSDSYTIFHNYLLKLVDEH